MERGHRVGRWLAGVLLRGWCRLPWLVQDAVIAGAAALVTCLPLLDLAVWGSRPQVSWAGVGLVWGLLVLGGCAPLVLRRRYPLVVAGVSAGMVTLAAVLDQPQVGLWAALVGLGSAAYHVGRGVLLLGVGAAAWMLVNFSLVATSLLLSDVIMIAGTGAAPVVFGYALRLQRDRAEHLVRLRRAEDVRERAEERTRVAREVHDIVGHHLSAIRVQAVGARYALRGSPPEADRALGIVAEISGEALQEVQQILALLRNPDDDGDRTTAGDTETSGGGAGDRVRLADVRDLAARLSVAGLRVRVVGDDRGLADPLPATLQYCAYRVVQESLTNVVRHSGAREATVHIRVDSRELVVTVDDDGQTRPGSGEVAEGSGVRGMRERVSLASGTLTAGPQHPHGWRVRATLPFAPEAR